MLISAFANMVWITEKLISSLGVLRDWTDPVPVNEGVTREYLKNFKKKECSKFIAVVANGDTCHCGLQKEKHINPNTLPVFSIHRRSLISSAVFTDSTPLSTRQISPSPWSSGPMKSCSSSSSFASFADSPWIAKECIQEFPTDAYGTLSFINTSKGTCQTVEYLRLSDETAIGYRAGDSSPNVLHLFEAYWKLLKPSCPNLVISIAGDTQVTNIDSNKREKIISGLIKAVKSTNAWLLTDGMDTGYTKLVGKAVNKSQSFVEVKGGIVLQIKCIGVVPFGRIRDVFSFVKGGNSIHTGINLKSEATPVHDCHPPALNEDHTHLLLVDDGFSYDKSNAESFRSSLLDAIQVERPSGLGIPAVVLVLDGGVSALRECLMALQCNTPVMVVEGTGRAADLLAYAASRYSSPIVRNGKVVAEQELNEDQRKEVFDQVSRFMPELREDECLECAEYVSACCERGSLITIFNVSSDSSMDKYILYSLLTGRAALTDQLELALQWNRVDVAEEKIFPQFQCTGEETILLNKIMTKAILDQKQDFIELLLQRDVIMSQYLNVGVLRQLYNSIRPRYHFGHLIRKSPDEEIYLRDVHLLLQRLVGKHDHHLYVNDIENSHQDKAQFEDPYLELLLWAVLSRRDHLAVYLWQKCQSPLRALIVATCLYKSMEESVSAGDTMLKEAYSKMRWTFEGYAVELLERCYKKDHAKAVRLMEEVNGRWGEICLLDIALSAGNMRLVSTACCQDRVAQRWRKLRVKFWISQASRVVLCLMHCYLVLFHMVLTPSLLELLLACFVISDAIEKVFEATSATYFKLWLSAWNIYDLFTQIIFIAGFLCRHFPETFVLGKIFYGCCAMLFCCRLFRIYYINERLGPLILIFVHMVPKILEFLAFLALLLVGYGITSKALMNHPCNNRNQISSAGDFFYFIADGLFTPYWKMFGEIDLEDLENHKWSLCQYWKREWIWETSCNTCDTWNTNSTSECICKSSTREERFATQVMLSIYLIVSNILLVNLVIAIFTHVFEQVQQKSSEHWKFEMCRLAREYEGKPLLPPPFGPFIYIWRYLRGFCSSKIQDELPLQFEMKNTLRIFERQELQNLSTSRRKASTLNLQDIYDRLLYLEEKISDITKELSITNNVQQVQPIQSNAEGLEDTLKIHLAPFESLSSLPSYVSSLEDNLIAFHRRLGAVQASQNKEINHIKTLIENLEKSLALKKKST